MSYHKELKEAKADRRYKLKSQSKRMHENKVQKQIGDFVGEREMENSND